MQPTWITPAGSLGVIPEQVFYTQNLVATVPYFAVPANCTATSASNNAIICDTTEDAFVGAVVSFFGTNFGGLQENRVYYVLQVLNATSFTITDVYGGTQPVALTTATGTMTARFAQPVLYKLQAGTLPAGIQIDITGSMIGVPSTSSTAQGVPAAVAEDVTNKFTLRAYTTTTVNGRTVIDGIADRTFTLTITGNDVPQFVTPAGLVASYYDGDQVDLQIDFESNDPNEEVIIRVVAGQLPLGLRITPDGLIFGTIQPFPDDDNPPGYDLQPSDEDPYDFVSAAISKIYQFTLEATDRKSSSLRTYEIAVYNRLDLTADDTYITADNTFVTADQTTERIPVLLNFEPTHIGTVRGDNRFAYRFIGYDFDIERVEYAITVNEGFGLPPGLELDPYSGWLYGTIPDVGTTQNTYSFNIQVRAVSVVCIQTIAATNTIVCDATARADLYVGTTVVFEGTGFGSITPGTTYYVSNIVSDTQFQISETFGGPVFALTSATGVLRAIPADLPSSRLYPFTLTVTGDTDSEVTWITDADLGVIENGAVSHLRIEAVNRGGLPLQYELATGEFNELPQGLSLLPSGEIAGRVTFNTFAIDLGSTTFDESLSTITRLDPTTFDSTFVFTVNAYSEDDEQALYKVSNIKVVNGGSGFSSSPAITLSQPVGAAAVQATAAATVSGGAITAVTVTNPGAQYTGTATYVITGTGSGAELNVIMQPTGFRRLVSVYKTFTVRVLRRYNRPYQDLYVVAMPPQNDRVLLENLLSDTSIFVPDAIYRPTDPNFGVSKQVIYQHAVGLSPVVLDTYVESLYLNHYWKNLVLGHISTAQALDSSGALLYEVVYSPVIDDLVNAQGQSVSKIVTLPYSVIDPADGSTVVNSVYPNSLINMRDQVIDIVGQISQQLPAWMTSRQADGRVLGFTPAWVICYTKPGQSERIAYYIRTQFGERLNVIDFKVDRYVLDSEMSRHWNPATQNWTPEPSQTTFDRVDTQGYTDIGLVNACTELAFADVNNQPLSYINALGGLDGPTWVQQLGITPPPGTTVTITNGSRIIFVKQDNFNNYSSTDDAFSANSLFDAGLFDPFWQPDPGDPDQRDPDVDRHNGQPGTFDYGRTVSGGYVAVCSATDASTNFITATSTLDMSPGDRTYFTGTTFGGIQTQNIQGFNQPYVVYDVDSLTATATSSSNDRITVSSTAGLTVGDEVWFGDVTIGDINAYLANGDRRPYYVLDIPNGTQLQIAATPGGTVLPLSTDTGSMTMFLPRFRVADPATPATPFQLITASGVMTVNYNNDRMAIYTVTIVGDNQVISLSLDTQTIANDYVTSTQGANYNTGTYLYRPLTIETGETRISWQPLITATPVIADQTIFDGGSVQWVDPVDMYTTSDASDKYLVFPKTNILS